MNQLMKKYPLLKHSIDVGDYLEEIHEYETLDDIKIALTYVNGNKSELNGVNTIQYAAVAYTKDSRPSEGDIIVADGKRYEIGSIIPNKRYYQLNLKLDDKYES